MLPTYTRLNAENAEIRLLHLLPGQPSDLVQCTLHVASLKNPPEYEALSYVWGDATIRKEIVMDGHGVTVTASLESALRVLRGEDAVHIVWADALCINQEDVLEKNVHIPIMGRVYATASSVAVWLGESDPKIEFAINWFLEQKLRDSQIEILGDPEEEKVVNGTLALLQHPYWTRMWTFQEFRLSEKDPILLHGKQRLSSHVLKGVINFAKVDRSVVREANGKLHDLRLSLPFIMGEFNRDYWNGIEGLSMTSLLSITALRECQDPRDHVYALYGILPKVAEELPPEYDATPKQVMYKTAAYLIYRESMTLGRLLMYYCLYEDRLLDTYSPSWIPNFAKPLVKSESEHQFFTYDFLSDCLTEGTMLDLLADTPVLKLRAGELGKCKVLFRFGYELHEIIPRIHQYIDSHSKAWGPYGDGAADNVSIQCLSRIISAQTINPNKIAADEVQ